MLKKASGLMMFCRILLTVRHWIKAQAQAEVYSYLSLSPEPWPGFYWAAENALDSHHGSPWESRRFYWAVEWDEFDEDDY